MSKSLTGSGDNKKPTSVTEIVAYISENPKAKVKVTGPSPLSKNSGKRAQIFAIMAKGGTIAEMLPKFKQFGGGIKDIEIALNGSKKNSFKSYITLES
tara:strand:+ start:167 stop:460 length:294 start_codon:yes stop_codon:yes gene_type:complete